MKTFVCAVVCCLGCLLMAACSDEHQVVIPVQEVTLNKNTLLLAVGEEASLKATVYPQEATQQGLKWTSLHTDVAQVDAQGVVRALKVGETQVQVTTVDGGRQAVCRVIVSENGAPSTSKRTVLVYMAADNNLGVNPPPGISYLVNFAREDYREMMAGMQQLATEGCHLLVYKDWQSLDQPVLVELISNLNGGVEERVIKTYEDRNSTGLAETKEVFADVFGHPDFQAQSYGLVYWSHGDGWIPFPEPRTRWVGQDTGQGDRRMNLKELTEILSTAPHFDFIMFDACFMQGLEVGYELREYADYLIASPTETPGPGAPYDVILPYMFTEGGAAQLANAYYEVYAAKYNGTVGSNQEWTAGVSIAAVKLSALERLAALTAKGLAGVDPNQLAQLSTATFDYDRRPSYYHIGYYDAQGMMNHLMEADDFASWKQAYEEALVFWKTTPKNYSQYAGMFPMVQVHGVTHYIPSHTQSGAARAYRETDWYRDAGLSQLGW